MKIVYCIAGTYNSGGMERVLSNKANYLAALGHELTVITTDQGGREPYFPLDSRIEQIDLGINYKEIKGLFKKLLFYPIRQLKHKRQLCVVLERLKADVVISMFDHEAPLLHKMKDGSKKVLEIHFSRYKRLQYGRKGIWAVIDHYRSKQDLWLAGQYDRFVVLTREDKSYWDGLDNITVIPNANTFEPIEMARLENKRVLAVGRYDEQKAFDELIRAWVQVHEQHPDWSLVIFGEGPLKQDLQALINQLGLATVVQLCSPVQDIEKEYLASAMLVMTSRYEGLPMALLEAQACGLPLLAYACKCGPEDIIREGENGYLLAEGNRQGLAWRINFLAAHNLLRKQMGMTSRAFSENYAKEIIMQQWLELFEQLTCRKK